MLRRPSGVVLAALVLICVCLNQSSGDPGHAPRSYLEVTGLNLRQAYQTVSQSLHELVDSLDVDSVLGIPQRHRSRGPGPPGARRLAQWRSRYPLTIPEAQGLRVVLVNDMAGHYEVLAGLLHVLNKAGVKPDTLFVGRPRYLWRSGFFSWINATVTNLPEPVVVPVSEGATVEATQIDPAAASEAIVEQVEQLDSLETSRGRFFSINPYSPETGASERGVVVPLGLKADMVICVSPELSRGECKTVVEQVEPQFLVTFVHRGEFTGPFTGIENLTHKRALVALAPHVAKFCENKTKTETEWLLPTAPLGYNHSAYCRSRACLSGFAIQGSIRGMKTAIRSGMSRNYTELWGDLIRLRTKPRQAQQIQQLLIKVLGRGSKDGMGIPEELESNVVHMKELPYPEFWREIHRSLALVPCFGLEEYYTSRLSSTIIASIITGTPLIADRRLLAAYTFLKPKHVFLQRHGESEAAAMLRIMNMSENEVMRPRRALIQLRHQLNARSLDILRLWMQQSKAD